MTNEELLVLCTEQINSNKIIDLPNDVFLSLSKEQAEFISNKFKHNTLMKLPESEILFFEWVKQVDNSVWADLWDNQDEEPYLVSLSFLPQLTDKYLGFPICDLLENDNYYFTSDHFADREAVLLVDTIKTRFMAKEKLTPAQCLMMEISIAPIDIWHFAYKYKLSIQTAKDAVESLVEDKVLIHLTQADELADFVNI